MRLAHLLLALVLAFMSPGALAAEVIDSPLQARAAWDAQQVLVRGALRVEVDATDTRPAQAFWLFVERTPHGRIRMLVKDSIEGETQLTLLVQDSTCLGIAGEDVFPPGPPWMLGQHLFGQPMEPSMLVSWAMGLPGRSFSVEARPAVIDVEASQVGRIAQDGWTVDYLEWGQQAGADMILPTRMRVSSEGGSATISVVRLETFRAPPEDYTEFRIM